MESFNTESGKWVLELLHVIQTEDAIYYYKKKELSDNGYFAPSTEEYTIQDLYDDGISPVKEVSDVDDDEEDDGIFKLDLKNWDNWISSYENNWLPLPYFIRKDNSRYTFGPVNWSRFKLVPTSSKGADGTKRYNVLLAFDTRTGNEKDKYNECPVFTNQYETELHFGVCEQEFYLMDFCSPQKEWDYIDKYLMSLAHPGVYNPSGIKSKFKLSYVASYFLLIDYIAQNKLFPCVTLYSDKGVVTKGVDMVVDIGNSRTTALLVEDNFNFNQISQLQLIDYTSINSEDACIRIYQEPFDMRLALRKVVLGNFGIGDSRQFVYPSIVRLGKEANKLIHIASEEDQKNVGISTLSSPKRYLWAGHRNDEEWKFITLAGEKDDHILSLEGVTEYLNGDGSLALNGTGGQTHRYSRRSMMMFAFLEMLVQAETQLNSDKYRTDRGDKDKPRRIHRIVVTCPTTMSKLEREALVKCASDAVKLKDKFYGTVSKVEIIPAAPSFKDTDSHWYYDEATCSQLVYIYGEVGYKYKGSCQEFFNLYGKKTNANNHPELTVGSLDIGGGTTDLMICRYSYKKDAVTTVQPLPLFYDSYYFAGDDMLYEMVRNIMFSSTSSALRRKMENMTESEYKQKLRNFFGPDYAGQTVGERRLRCDFNLQYSIPLMYRYLELVSQGSNDCNIHYEDVFDNNEPNVWVKKGFQDFFGFSMEDLVWDFKREEVSEVIHKSFEPLLKIIATIMYSYECDIILLSGRPASLAPIRNIFLKYYPVSPNRLILLNNYYVGHWYPFANNTGYIANAKTIVAMGALIGYYATKLGNLPGFAIDKSVLDSSLKSVVNYILSEQKKLPIEYLITPEKDSADMTVNTIPTTLIVRQLGLDSYPARVLYVINFNTYRIGEQIRAAAQKDGTSMTDKQVMAQVDEEVSKMRQRLPFKLTVEQDADNKEKLSIVSITDKNGDDIRDNKIEINIQSLGIDNSYWLDSGAFEIL